MGVSEIKNALYRIMVAAALLLSLNAAAQNRGGGVSTDI